MSMGISFLNPRTLSAIGAISMAFYTYPRSIRKRLHTTRNNSVSPSTFPLTASY